MAPNKTMIFKKIPDGWPVPGQDFAVEDKQIDLGKAPAGGIIVKNLFASLDPYMRGRMRDSKIKSYTPAFEVGGPMANDCIGKIVKSDLDKFKEGDLVIAHVPIAQYAVISSNAVASSRCRPVHNPHNLDLALFLGALGMPGLTAWSSFYKIGQPKKGETIFVSSAAGAVGQIVGQLAKHEGLRVIGSAGSAKKVDFIEKELGLEGFNYKEEKPGDALKRLAPDGINIFYDNVGGEMLDAALVSLKSHGRVILCGAITGYNDKSADDRAGIKNLVQAVGKCLTLQGFLVGDPAFGPVYYQEHQEKLQAWLADGSFKAKVNVTDGIDDACEAFIGLLKGDNFGKAVVKIADP